MLGIKILILMIVLCALSLSLGTFLVICVNDLLDSETPVETNCQCHNCVKKEPTTESCTCDKCVKQETTISSSCANCMEEETTTNCDCENCK